MTELQKARADWLAAESKVLELQKQNSELTQRNYELQMKLYVAEARARCAEVMHEGFIAGLFKAAV